MPSYGSYPLVTAPAPTDLLLVKQGAATKGIPLSRVRNVGWFNVKDYGAVGDNSNDDTAAFQAAITAAGANSIFQTGGTVYIPAGYYKLTSMLVFPDPATLYYNGISFLGEGVFCTNLQWYGPQSDEADQFDRAICLKIAGQTGYRAGNFTLRNLGGPTDSHAVGISMTGSNPNGGTNTGQCVWESVRCTGWDYGIQCGDPTTPVGHAASELLFLHPVLDTNNIGLACYDLNTFSTILVMLEAAGNGIGIQGNNSENINVFGGSTAANSICDFQSNGGSITVNGVNSQSSYLLTCQGGVGVFQNCVMFDLGIRSAHSNGNAVDLKGGFFTFIGCQLNGDIRVRLPGTLTLIGCQLSTAEVAANLSPNLPPILPVGASDYIYGASPDSPGNHTSQETLDRQILNVLGCAIQSSDQFTLQYLPDQSSIYYGNVPMGTLRLNNLAAPSGAFAYRETPFDPTAVELSSGSDAKDRVAQYMKNNKLVFAYNDAGTVTYLSIPLDGSSTAWTHSTSAP